MTLDRNSQTIARAMTEVPASVRAAEANLVAARALATKVADEQPPSMAGVTAKGQTAALAAATDYAVRHPLEVANVNEMVRNAEGEVDNAWSAAVNDPATEAEFAQRFNDAADELRTELTNLGEVDVGTFVKQRDHNPRFAELARICDTLDGLSRARDALANRHGPASSVGLFSTEYERLSRTAVFVDGGASIALHGKVRQHSGPERWIVTAQCPGVTIKWQTRAEQLAQPEPASQARTRTAMLHRAAEARQSAI